jgi:hypothetical protein
MSKFWRRFEVFFCALILVGMSGMNISGAATVKASKPSAPTDLVAVGALESAILKWKAPNNNGGQKITSYRVNINSGSSFYICKGAATSCAVPIKNPNKPSAKPIPVWFYFTVAATNSVGTGPDSISGQAKAQIRFRATIYIDPNLARPQPSTAPPSPSTNAITNYDGLYSGSAVVSVSINSGGPASASYSTTFTVLNGVGNGAAEGWTVSGKVTDVKGVAAVTASNSTYGSLSFTVNFLQDPVTHVMTGSGKGERAETLIGIGEVKVDFVYNVSRQP